MCGTAVRKLRVDREAAALVGLAARPPRGSARRWRPSRPTENSTMSATIRLPDSSAITARRGGPVARPRCASTASPRRNVTFALAHLVHQLVDDLARRGTPAAASRFSTSVTSTPSAREHRRVLDADHARADDGHACAAAAAGSRMLVARDDDLAVGATPGGGDGRVPHRDQDVLGVTARARLVPRRTTERVRIQNDASPATEVDVVAARAGPR